MAQNNGSWVVARNSDGDWYVYRSTFSADVYIGRTDCLAFNSRAEASEAAYDLWCEGL